MNILIVANVHFPVNLGSYMGGIETIVGESFKLINTTGEHKAYLATTPDSQITEFTDMTYRHEKNSVWEIKKDPTKKRVMFGLNTDSIKEFCKEKEIDIIFSNAPRAPFVRELCKLGLPILHLLHQGIYAHFDYHTYKNIFSYLENSGCKYKIAAVSNFVKDNVNESFPGVVTEVLNPSLISDLPDISPQASIDFLTAGRIQPNYFIKEIAEAVVNAGYKIHIAGSLNDNNSGYCDSFLSFVDSNKDKVFYHGQLSHESLMELMGKTKVYISPVNHEAYGMAVLEALSMGCSLIGIGNKDLTGSADFLSSNCRIIDCNIKKPIELSEKILEVFDEGFYCEDLSHYYRENHNKKTFEESLVDTLVKLSV